MKNWVEFKQEFIKDGALRDIYAFEASESIWNEFIYAVSSCYSIEFSVDGEDSQLPNSFSNIKLIQNDSSTLLSILLEGEITINCHFFSEHQIELDFWPSDVKNEEDFSTLNQFLLWLRKVVNLKVIVTHENSPELEILAVE
jgi:hypothetical protein